MSRLAISVRSLAVAFLLTGLAVQAAPAAAEAPLPPSRFSQTLQAAGLKHTRPKPEMWKVEAQGSNFTPQVLILQSEKFCYFLVPLFKVPENASASFYQHVLKLNGDLPQVKFCLTDQNTLYAAYEVPLRLLDKGEFLACTQALAILADKNYPELKAKARYVGEGGVPESDFGKDF